MFKRSIEQSMAIYKTRLFWRCCKKRWINFERLPQNYFRYTAYLADSLIGCWKMADMICKEIVRFIQGFFQNRTNVYLLNPRIWLVVKGNRNNDPIIHIGLAWAGFELTHHRQCRLLFVVNFFNSTQIKILTLSMIFEEVWHIQSCQYCFRGIFICENCDEIP